MQDSPLTTSQIAKKPNDADPASVSDSDKPKPFDVEAMAAALLAAVGPNDPFPTTVKVYPPCKFLK